jgi:hypothetical protein
MTYSWLMALKEYYHNLGDLDGCPDRIMTQIAEDRKECHCVKITAIENFQSAQFP